ncbi:MAG: hypothetical protein JZU65_10850 [Chlorobium sp.]|nr:hypothetical protein [Chlorobium sp.]
MKTQTNTFIFSFLTHTVLVGCAFALSQQAMPDKPPIVVNFTLEQTASPTQATSSPQSGEENNGVREDIAVEKTPTEPPKEIVEKPVEKDKPDVLPKKKAAVQKIKRKPVERAVPTDSPLPPLWSRPNRYLPVRIAQVLETEASLPRRHRRQPDMGDKVPARTQ